MRTSKKNRWDELGKEKNTIVLDAERIAKKTLEYFAEAGLGLKMDSVEAEKGLVESLVNDFMETETETLENNLAREYVQQFIREEIRKDEMY